MKKIMIDENTHAGTLLHVCSPGEVIYLSAECEPRDSRLLFMAEWSY
jgi:hypothetical protein